MIERFKKRVAIHRVKGCEKGYKTCEKAAQLVAIL